MLRDESYFRTLDKISAARDASAGDAILKAFCQDYGLDTAAYLGMDVPGGATDLPFAAVTYSNDWVLHYIEKNYLEVDPVLKHGTKTILPVDWDEFERDTPRVIRFFDEARQAGVGRRGVTLPIRGRFGETALFSVSASLPRSDWWSYKRRFLAEFQMIAIYFHDLTLRVNGFRQEAPDLTERELECLRWAARGKSFEDIGAILGLTARGVKFHLDLARHKLSALNVTHAVARAMAAQVIGPPD